ncbi:MAG: S8 family serine peptidase [Bacteroidetes bacterium]|nr:S8 family serine peptidase [Bacteroidota bacterium]
MQRKFLFLFIVLITISFVRCNKIDEQAQVPFDSTLKSASVNGKYIVVLNKDQELAKSDLQARNEKVKGKAFGLLKKFGISGEVEDVYETAIQGFTVKMTPGQAKKMLEDSSVKYIEADQIVTLSPIVINTKPGGGTQPPQTIGWGISRVGGGVNNTIYGDAWIIDTGVDLSHPDLNVDKTRGVSFVSRVTSPNDDNGHGSHVAGIIGAKYNDIGVVGVAPGALVIPVKVLDRRGSGTYSAVIAGVNYVGANGKPGDVANMSLGGPVSQALDDAVSGASANVKFVLAAGNESADSNNSSPARVNGTNIYTISAMGQGDLWAYFSNFGNPPVDYCAPGVSIYSTYKGDGYATMSGTSMAAPHVAGLILLGVVKTDGVVQSDPDGNPDPIAHH